MYRSSIVALLICISISGSAYAQQKYKSERNADIIEYTSRDGLPTSNISSVVQTPDGYVWIASAQGTVRFDGYEFAYTGKEFGVPDMQAVFFDSQNNILYFASPTKLIQLKDGIFTVFDEKDGYRVNGSSGQIISFIKSDSKGRIWIGSQTLYIDSPFNGGLTKFENGKFFAYDSISFPLHNATDFIETPYGDLIFASSGKNTQNGDEAYIASYKGDKFTRIDESMGVHLINPVLGGDEFGSAIDDDGNTWIAFIGNTDFVSDGKNVGSGVLKYDGAKFHQYPGLQKYFKSMLSIGSAFFSKETGKVYTCLSSRVPRIYNSENKEIFEFQNDRWIPSNILQSIGSIVNIKSGEAIKDFKYTSVKFYDKGATLPLGIVFNTEGPVGSSANPSQYFVRNGTRWEKYDYLPGIPMLDLKKGLLLSTSKGIGFYHPEESKMLTEKDGLASSNVGIPNFYIDKNQIVWMSYSYTELPTYAAMNEYGLNLWDGKRLLKITEKDGLAGNSTFNILHDNEDRVWIGTSKGVTLVREFKNTKGEWVFKFNKIPNSGNTEYSATSLLETAKGEVYAWQNFVRRSYGGFEEAVFFLGRYDGSKFVDIKSPFSEELSSKPYQLIHLREDRKGQLWLEGLFADEVNDLTSVKTEIKIFDGGSWYSPPDSWSIPDEQLHYVGDLANGTYYLTVGHFYKFDGNRFIDLSDSVTTEADYTILKGASVAGTKTDIQVGERLYIRLRNRGLVIFDGTKLRFYTPKEGFIATDIHDPMIDFRGNVFFASRVGAVMITGDDFRIYYDDQNIASGGPNTVTIDGEGNFIKYYNGIGLYIDQQKDSRINLKITGVAVNDEEFFYKYPENLEYSRNSLRFNFSALNFDDPAETTFEYFLDGYDKDWSRPSNRSFAEYQNLPSGSFDLRVRAKNANGISASETSYSFGISPPWWNTWWAYFLYILLFSAIMYSLRRIELNRQFKNSRIKESELKAKAAELQVQAAEAQSRAIQAENERKTKEFEEARALQLSLLPKDVPVHPNVQISTYMKTATEVGGDYYDFSQHEDGSLNVAIGDATGHGMKAGTLVSMMKSLFVANSVKMDIQEFFTSSNKALKKMHLERVMMGFAMLRINGRSIKTINAGMPHYFHFVKKTGKVSEIKINGMPLGGMVNSTFEEVEIKLDTGDSLLMLSDGMPELQNSKNEMYSYDRIASEFEKVAEKSPEEIIESLKETGSDWIDNRDPEDDVTFVVVKMK